jgi:hypothetical protein
MNGTPSMERVTPWIRADSYLLANPATRESLFREYCGGAFDWLNIQGKNLDESEDCSLKREDRGFDQVLRGSRLFLSPRLNDLNSVTCGSAEWRLP